MYSFPAEQVPDGAILAPHHFYWGGFLALFGFLFVWKYYPALGATLALFGTGVMADDVIAHAFGVWTPCNAVWAYVVHGFGPWIH